MYLIELTAYIEGYKEVGLTYLFPGQTKVFANWFNGEIRIPQGEVLEYVHMGYASLYESDLFLVFKNGILVNQYEVDNEVEYQNRLSERHAKKAKEKKEEKILAFWVITILALVFIGICTGMFFLIKMGTVFGYLISTILAIGVILLFILAIKSIIKHKRNAAELKNLGL